VSNGMDVTRPRTPGYIRTAWTAGSTPGRDPTRAAPPTQAAQGRRWSTRSRMRRWPWRAAPVATPAAPPRTASRMASWTNGMQMCALVPLSARTPPSRSATIPTRAGLPPDDPDCPDRRSAERLVRLHLVQDGKHCQRGKQQPRPACTPSRASARSTPGGTPA
jgi:hypothetical protein